MDVTEIKLADLDPQRFIREQCAAIAAQVGDGTAVNALSGGVDSSVVTMLAHRALGERLKTFFIDNGLMREGEPERVVDILQQCGAPVPWWMRGRILRGPEGQERSRGEAPGHHRHLLPIGLLPPGQRERRPIPAPGHHLHRRGGDGGRHQAAAQHPGPAGHRYGHKEYGYTVIEPLIRLRKPAVRAVGQALGLPEEIYNRPPFPGPALVARVIGEATRERIALVRKATVILEEELAGVDAFQYMAILHNDRIPGCATAKAITDCRSRCAAGTPGTR
jgi:GMP synthase (glutamine-hydrolysing)